MRHRLTAQPLCIHRSASGVAGCAREGDIRWMDDVFTRTDLTRMGFTRNHIAAAVGCCLRVVRRGSYVRLPGCADAAHSPYTTHAQRPSPGDGSAPQNRPRRTCQVPPRARLLVRRVASRGRGAVAHLRSSGVGPSADPLLSSAQAEVSRPARSRRYASLHVRHRSVAGARVVRHGLRVTSLTRTLLDVAADHHLDISVPMIDHALRHGMTTRTDLAKHAGGSGDAPRCRAHADSDRPGGWSTGVPRRIRLRRALPRARPHWVRRSSRRARSQGTCHRPH